MPLSTISGSLLHVSSYNAYGQRLGGSVAALRPTSAAAKESTVYPIMSLQCKTISGFGLISSGRERSSRPAI